MRDVAVVLVNYRCEDHTADCLAHLRATLRPAPTEVVVVDNSPARGLNDSLAARVLSPRVLAMDRNLGFAAAANRGIAATTTPIVVLLNPDARPQRGCLEGLAVRLRDDPLIGAAGPVLEPFDASERPRPSATAIDPGIFSAMLEYTALHRCLGRGWLARRYFVAPDGPGPAGLDCAMVQGACLAVRREAFDGVGGFDAERFFLYWEETDLERRMRRAGWRVLYCRDLFCRHLGGASLDPGVHVAENHFWRGFYAYHRKHGGVSREILLRVLMTPGMAAEATALWLLDRIRRGRDAAVRGDLAVARRRLRLQLPLRDHAGVR